MVRWIFQSSILGFAVLAAAVGQAQTLERKSHSLIDQITRSLIEHRISTAFHPAGWLPGASDTSTVFTQSPFPALAEKEQEFIDQVLLVWEKRAASVETLSCSFVRWDYDTTRFQHPTDSVHSFFREVRGELAFMKGGKFLYRVDDVMQLSSVRPPAFRPHLRPFGELWCCDGKWLYDRDRNTKTERQFELSPMQRKALSESSPFLLLFEVSAKKLKQRYWLRCIKSDDRTVWVEAWPKWASDAGCFSRVQVVLSRKDILPSAMIVFAPNWTAQREHKQIYQFSNRKERKLDSLASFQGFFGGELTPGNSSKDGTASSSLFGEFFSPGIVPAGYKLVYNPNMESPDSVSQVPSKGESLAFSDRTEPEIQTKEVSTYASECVVSCRCTRETKRSRSRPRRGLLRRRK